MENRLKKIVLVSVLIAGLGLSVILTGSCDIHKSSSSAGSDVSEDIRVNSENVSASSELPNPAARKCINDGFVLKPVLENGIPVKYLCINPETGLKCDVWDYFRNECTLSIKERGGGTEVRLQTHSRLP